MLIHQLSTGVYGKFEEIKDNFINDEALMKLLYKLYNEHTSMDNKTIKTVLKRDIWWTATECLEHGLVDGIWKNDSLNIKSCSATGDIFDTQLVTSNKVFPVRTSLNAPLSNEVSKSKKRMRKIYELESDSDSESDSESDSGSVPTKKQLTNTNTETEAEAEAEINPIVSKPK
jgi:hypothetical protein